MTYNDIRPAKSPHPPSGSINARPDDYRKGRQRDSGLACAHVTCKSMTPLPSTSYIRNAHWSFSSGVPADVTSMASKNSLNPQPHRPEHVEKC